METRLKPRVPYQLKIFLSTFFAVCASCYQEPEFDLSGRRRRGPDFTRAPWRRGGLQPSRIAMGEACLQLPSSSDGESGRRSGPEPGCFLEGLSEHPQAGRPGAIRPMAVPDCAQRGLFALPQTPARNGA